MDAAVPQPPPPLTVQVLMSPGCSHGLQTVRLVSEMIATFAPEARLRTIVIRTEADAELHGFPGSPTVRVDGKDIDPHAPASVGLG